VLTGGCGSHRCERQPFQSDSTRHPESSVEFEFLVFLGERHVKSYCLDLFGDVTWRCVFLCIYSHAGVSFFFHTGMVSITVIFALTCISWIYSTDIASC